MAEGGFMEGGAPAGEGDVEMGKGGKTSAKVANAAPGLYGDQEKYIAYPPSRGMKIGSIFPVLWFPIVADKNQNRVGAVLVSILCVFGIIFRNHRSMHWIIAGMAGDFVARFCFGGSMSIFGSMSMLAGNFIPRKLSDGAPLQFAQFCGVIFSALAMILFFLESNIAGAVVLAMLFGAAALQGFLDFCVACWMFGYFIKFGLVTPEVKDEAHDAIKDAKTLLEWADTHPKFEKPMEVEFANNVPEERRAAALHYKIKNDEYTRDDFHVVRHMQITYFSMPMSLASVALVWLEADSALGTPSGLWKGVAIFSGVIFGAFLLLYIVRTALYPKKVAKEWQHPGKRSFFSTIPVTILLFAYIAARDDQWRLCQVLFWIAAPVQMLQAVLMTSYLVKNPLYIEFVNSGWMMPLLGNFVAAFVAPWVYGPTSNFLQYQEVGWLWFSSALFMWPVLAAIDILRIITEEKPQDKLRSAIFLYVAAPAMAGLSWMALTQASVSPDGSTLAFAGFDNFSRFCFYCTWGFVLVMLSLGLQSYFWATRFDMYSWGYVFPLATVAFISQFYHQFINSSSTKALMYAAMVAVNWAAFIATMQTLNLLVKHNMFVPEDKWGPMSFMKIIHEAFRGAMSKLQKQCQNLVEAPSGPNLRAVETQFSKIMLLLGEHSKHEEAAQYPLFDSYFPGATAFAHEEHMHGDEESAAVTKSIEAFKSAKGGEQKAAAAASVQAAVASFVDDLRGHLRREEDHLNHIGRKFIPIRIHKESTRRIWEATPMALWAELLPFIMVSLERHPQRVRFLRCLRWAMPFHAQTLGRLLYQGLPRLYLWKRLAEDVPEIVPRGLPGWMRYY